MVENVVVVVGGVAVSVANCFIYIVAGTAVVLVVANDSSSLLQLWLSSQLQVVVRRRAMKAVPCHRDKDVFVVVRRVEIGGVCCRWW